MAATAAALALVVVAAALAIRAGQGEEADSQEGERTTHPPAAPPVRQVEEAAGPDVPARPPIEAAIALLRQPRTPPARAAGPLAAALSGDDPVAPDRLAEVVGAALERLPLAGQIEKSSLDECRDLLDALDLAGRAARPLKRELLDEEQRRADYRGSAEEEASLDLGVRVAGLARRLKELSSADGALDLLEPGCGAVLATRHGFLARSVAGIAERAEGEAWRSTTSREARRGLLAATEAALRAAAELPTARGRALFVLGKLFAHRALLEREGEGEGEALEEAVRLLSAARDSGLSRNEAAIALAVEARLQGVAGRPAEGLRLLDEGARAEVREALRTGSARLAATTRARLHLALGDREAARAALEALSGEQAYPAAVQVLAEEEDLERARARLDELLGEVF